MKRQAESLPMQLAYRFGMDGLAWSLRRFHCPVMDKELVLEVGSGGNPYARANVLLDAYEETRERHWQPLVRDRPTVLGFGECLPFKDKVFDFVIAAHVLEHTAEPEKFLAELQRVGRAGYIETPDAFMERINPYRDHRLEVTVRDDCLIIRKKRTWEIDKGLVELYERKAKRWMTRELIPGHPHDFHVRYYWEGSIKYSVVNPHEDASWPTIETDLQREPDKGIIQQLRSTLLRTARWLFSQTRRNSSLEVLSLLRCPKCHNGNLSESNEKISCSSCSSEYEIRQGLFIMKP